MSARRIESALPESLHEVFREQLAAVRGFVGQKTLDEVRPKLQAAMVQVLTQSLGLSKQAAHALSHVAVSRPGPDTVPLLQVVMERCALQRALVAAGLARDVRPYYEVAARAALDALSIPADAIVEFEPSSRVPTLPPIHSQDPTIEEGPASDIFKMKWES